MLINIILTTLKCSNLIQKDTVCRIHLKLSRFFVQRRYSSSLLGNLNNMVSKADCTGAGGPCKLRVNNIVKSEFDKREYRGLELQNGMKVVLISDPTTDKSAAALDVNIGYLCDPKELPGLAHFCEHMLFMGTETYPAENEYNKFLSEHSGYSNAYTSADHTNYHFEVSPDHLEKALDIFSKFFICPLFEAGSTEREVNAVNLEHDKNIPNDTWRLDQLDKSTCDPNHDYNRFGTGNKETLDTIPKSKGMNVRDELLKFHDKWYSSNIMGFAILGKESLDDLEKMVADKFKDVKNKNVKTPVWNTHPYGKDQLKTKTYVTPVKDLRSLLVTFPIPDLQDQHKSGPDSYLAHLIGHEGPGSLLSELRKRSWCNSLVGGPRHGAKGFAFFTVTVDLTLDGIEHADDIVELIFQYMKLLHDEGPQEWIFNEYKELLDIEFRFKEKEKPSSYVSYLCPNLFLYPLEEILVGTYMLTEYKPDLIRDLLDRLTPENMRLAVVGKQFEPKCDQTEPWYGTKYTREKLSDEQLKKFENVTSNSAFHLPQPNEFIATDFTLLAPDADIAPHPTIMYNSPLIRAWLKQDDEYKVPKLNASFEFISPYAYLDPECTNMTHLFISLFKDALNEYSYDAKLASLGWDLNNTKYGMMLNISGYSHKQSVLLSKVLDKLVEFSKNIDPKRYEIIKEQYARGLKNFEAEQPYQHAIYNISLCLFERAWSKTDLMESLDGITREKLSEFANELLSKMFIEALIHGNANKEIAMGIVKMLEEKLQTQLKTKPLLPSQVLRFREIKLPNKSNLVFESYNSVHKSSCIEIYYQCGLQNTKDNVLLELFAQLIHEPCFDVLRTKEQLGYIVMSGIRKSSGVQGLRVIVQSDKHPLFVEERIETFLNSMKELIVNMSDEEFERHKEALSSARLEKPKKLAGRSNRFWLEITTQQYNFDRANIEVAYLKTVTKEMILHFYNDLIARDAPFRHKLAIHLLSKAPGGAGTLTDTENQIVELRSKVRLIEDIVKFKSQQGLFSLPPPCIDIPPPPMAKSKL
uniref:Insulin-degrading enzyme n=5 Tax=Cacopsylla melanoneura TaxID=428564 RepID=A0A8D9BMR4_9HEMI